MTMGAGGLSSKPSLLSCVNIPWRDLYKCPMSGLAILMRDTYLYVQYQEHMYVRMFLSLGRRPTHAYELHALKIRVLI